MTTVEEFILDYMVNLSQATYAKSIRDAVRGLWTGSTNVIAFFDQMTIAIDKGVTEAWRSAFAEYGLSMDEMTTIEKGAMFNFMAGQAGFLDGFAADIMAGSKANGGKLGPQIKRSELWAFRWQEAKSIALQFAAKDKHLIWILGRTEKHCTTCLKLAGKVKRGSFWIESGIRPKHPALECGGWRCDCLLSPTDRQASRGRLPSIP